MYCDIYACHDRTRGSGLTKCLNVERGGKVVSLNAIRSRQLVWQDFKESKRISLCQKQDTTTKGSAALLATGSPKLSGYNQCHKSSLKYFKIERAKHKRA